MAFPTEAGLRRSSRRLDRRVKTVATAAAAMRRGDCICSIRAAGRFGA
jgi:hypothetical protein